MKTEKLEKIETIENIVDKNGGFYVKKTWIQWNNFK